MRHNHGTQPKRQYAGQIPKFWLPKLASSESLICKVIHWDLIDRFTAGKATRDDMWDWIETGFTYSQIMRLLAEDGTEFTDESMQAITDQINSYPAIIARWQTTGWAGFNGEQLNIARAAAHVMDGLIDMDRHGIAKKAALWSYEQMNRIRKC